jgi:formylglycine-generating enzyme required for sulfatase activity
MPRYFHDLVKDWVNDQPLTISTFEIARYPLTNAQYGLFVNDDGYNPDRSWWNEGGRIWLLRDDSVTEGLKYSQKRRYKQHPEFWHSDRYGVVRPNQPVVGISWYEAMAFCKWLTKHRDYNPEGYTYVLPSEAEWEYAARRATHRIYPWGNEKPDAERANFDGTYYGTSAVGCFPTSETPEDGIHDLSGNVLDWTRSAYQVYPYNVRDGREDEENPIERTFVIRGGGWNGHSSVLCTSSRSFFSPDGHNRNVGFRLVRYPPDKA